MMRLLIPFLILFSVTSFAQTDTATGNLAEVVVHAFERSRTYKDVPAAVGYIRASDLRHFNMNAAVSALNTIAGVRMEERSPGSYRLNIRGSSLRSPFGVRNVKVYYNDIPFTDPGGQTYLNILGAYQFASTEIIKGPAGSLYGAGNGGIVLIDPFYRNTHETLFAEYSFGSFDTHNIYARLNTDEKSQISLQHQQSNGYRDHSALRRDVAAWNGNYRFLRSTIKTSVLYGDLKYETPGALTQSEYAADPKASRPAVGSFPSAVSAKATVMQKMLLAGISLQQKINHTIENKTVVYGMLADLKNPTIQNYGHNREPHTGARTVFGFTNNNLSIQLGGELQQGFEKIEVYKNVNGEKDSLRTADKLNTRNAFAFLQIGYDTKNWSLTTAASVNRLRIGYRRLTTSSAFQKIRFNNLVPRLALMRKLKPFNIYASVAQGFSPPTTAEMFPSGNAVNTDLSAEQGLNYEIGVKGNATPDLFFNLNLFAYNLKNSIAQRRTAGGGDYYINAGKTKQKGAEASLQYFHASTNGSNTFNAYLNYAYCDFRYVDFKQLTNDYSGNRLPSVPKHGVSAGVALSLERKWYGTVNYYYASNIFLNDANTVSSTDYNLLSAKFSYIFFTGKKTTVTASVGADNLLNETYSLGNDINGFNGRYFNAAASRNYFVSLNIQLHK